MNRLARHQCRFVALPGRSRPGQRRSVISRIPDAQGRRSVLRRILDPAKGGDEGRSLTQGRHPGGDRKRLKKARSGYSFVE
jgi:hypothetical protein